MISKNSEEMESHERYQYNKWSPDSDLSTEAGPFLSEPIAVIGMGCRLPGDVDSPSKLWDLLKSGKRASSRVPPSRFNIDAFYHPNNERPGSLAADGGYFLNEDVRLFDNNFFGINNLEATYMDPEQRKLLEVVFECFENAGVVLERVSGANVGCYVGNFTYDFSLIQNKDADYLQRYSGRGLSSSILANRINHVFNLQGPSVTLDTACSSSLYGLHFACTALDANECDSAIVAGVNLIQTPEQHISIMKANLLSRKSICQSFDTAADGYGRGEAVAALYLKRLSKAIRDGDPIRSIIRGTAVNSNGRTPGITLPSAIGQEAAIRKAYGKAGLPLEVDYAECHATGTQVGDKIEVEGLSRAFNSSVDRPLLIGAIKPNIGHSEAASAISSIVKAILALEKGLIPATIGVENVNPKLKIDEHHIKIVTKNTAWPGRCGANVRRASVNSFGFGGANAHCVLEAAATYVPSHYYAPSKPVNSSKPFLLLLSAASEFSLACRIQDLHSFCEQNVSITDLAYTLGDRRSHLAVRGYILTTQMSLQDDLQILNLQTTTEPRAYLSQPIVFIFTGQGAQWPQMGRELINEFLSFRQTIEKLDSTLQSLPSPPQWTIKEVLLEISESNNIHNAAYAQPICTAVQIALADLLREWDIVPQKVVGHSSGEICAAYVSGHLSAEQAIIVAYYRGYVASGLKLHGAMLAVGLHPEVALEAIETLGLKDKVLVACFNSPQDLTLSGDADGIAQLLIYFQSKGISARELKVNGKGYHSHHMALVGQQYEDLITIINLLPGPKSVSFRPQWISTVTGDPVDTVVGPTYWRRNLESPVRFSDGLMRAVNESGMHLIEIGPHPVLKLPILQTISRLQIDMSRVHYFSTLTRGKPSQISILSLMGELFSHGHRIPITRINAGGIEASGPDSQGKFLLNLPNYRWKYDAPLWVESRASEEYRCRKYPRHDLLGSQIPGGSGIITWRNMVRVKDVPWTKDHRVDGSIVLPGAGFIAMAIEGVCQATDTDPRRLPPCHLQQIKIHRALVLDEGSDAGVELLTTISPMKPAVGESQEEWWQFVTSSVSGGVRLTHASGKICLDGKSQPLRQEICVDFEHTNLDSTKKWYDALSKTGLDLRGPFQSLTDIRSERHNTRRRILANIALSQGLGPKSESFYPLHPATVDGILHGGLLATSAGAVNEFQLRLPVSIESIRIQIPFSLHNGHMLKVRAAAEPIGMSTMSVSSEIYSSQHGIVVQTRNCRLIQPLQKKQAVPPKRHPMFNVAWMPDITMTNQEDLWVLIENRTTNHHSPDLEDVHLRRIIAAVDLFVFKNPELRILQIDDQNPNTTRALLDCLDIESTFRRCLSFTRSSAINMLEVLAEYTKSEVSGEYKFVQVTSNMNENFDLAILPSSVSVRGFIEKSRELLSPNSSVLGYCPPSDILSLANEGFSVLRLVDSESLLLILARRINQNSTNHVAEPREMILLENTPKRILNDLLETRLSKSYGQTIRRIRLSDVSLKSIPKGSTVISTIELDKAFFPKLSEEDFGRLKVLTDSVSLLVWVTGGDLTVGARPEYAFASSLSRSIRLEQPSTKFVTIDIDDPTAMFEQSASNILAVLRNALTSVQESDCEFAQVQGMLHISRFVPAKQLNHAFQRKRSLNTISKPIREATPFRIAFKAAGKLDSVYFKQIAPIHGDLEANIVEVDVKTLGIDTSVIDTLLGNVDTYRGTLTSECSGIVAKTGLGVSSILPGDRVAVIAPGFFATSERVPDWACIKLEENESFGVSSNLISDCSTAIYVLYHRARICAGESILVCSGACSLAIAVIQVAQLTGADVFTTVETEQEREYLIARLGMSKDCIFLSTGSEYPENLLAAADNHIDILISHSSKDISNTRIEALKHFGRIIHINNTGNDDFDPSLAQLSCPNLSFDLVCMRELYSMKSQKHHRIWASLIKESIRLLREDKIRLALPSRTFDIGDIKHAFQYLLANPKLGKVIVTLENVMSNIQVLPYKYRTLFDPEKTYFLVGCLGGLGRSMMRWMHAQGARRFMIISRSGLKDTMAISFVESLRKTGAEVTVKQGDVCKFSDVKEAIDQIHGTLGGIIHAAMVLDESLFTAMSYQQWTNTLNPKVVGTWNIHNAIKGKDKDLDFFLMTSSIAGSIPVATESNYSASNHFLDIFARYRRSASLPATSLSLGMISQVGYLHEHPDLKSGLTLHGLKEFDEDEFLQIIDTALSPPSSADFEVTDEIESTDHILSGLELFNPTELRERGFQSPPIEIADRRYALIRQAFGDSSYRPPTIVSSGLPTEVVTALESKKPIFNMLIMMISKQLSAALLTPLDKLEISKPLASFGMDSAVAVVLRTWFYNTFRVEVTFMALLSQTMTVRDLAEDIGNEVMKRVESQRIL